MADTLADTVNDGAQSVPEFPMPRADECPFAPPPALRALHAETPLTKARIWDGSTPWLVMGHADQRTLLADARVSTDEHQPGFPHQTRAMAETLDHRPPTIFNTDAPEHSRFRRMLTAPFIFKRVEALRPAIQKITDDHIDAMLAGPKPADLVTALALPVPSLMICELLGVPYTDHDFFQEHSVTAVSSEATPEESQAAAGALLNYLIGLIDAKLTDPGEDLLTDLAERVRAGETTPPEAALMAVVLLIAGHETSANMIALGTLALFQNPEQLALLRDTDDPKIVAGAVEELLRYLTIAHTGQRRIAREDIEIGGQVIRAGDGLVFPLSSANWDPDAFPEPERLDLQRSARHHNAFGFGIHQCLGQLLARVELQIVYGTLYRRVPTLRLATTLEEIKFKHDRLAYGVYELPVTW
ncbi:cytochrome P450 [Streptomyces sp. NBC_01537]|uniref:cytochrome P450 n=1 Tax=Streptomyces sp. NBC_01537 TaxID=2903896 RepID=UPI00387008B3